MSNDFVSLVDATDLDSFLVPAYGFEGPVPRGFQNVIVDGIGCYDPLSVNRMYMPRSGPDCSTSAQMTTAARDYRRNPNYKPLSQTGAPRPANTYNVCLLADGPRRFFNNERLKHVGPWWDGLNNGFRDCFAVWRRGNGEQLPPAYRFQDEVGRSIYAARSGNGVLYAATARIGADGKTDGYRIRVVCLKFEILDSDPAKSDLLRLTFGPRLDVLSNPTPKLEEYWLKDLEDWADHVTEAERGFTKFCKPLPEKVEERQKFLLNQWEQVRLLGAAYRSSIEGMHWQEALKTVDAAWKLAIVASVHGNRGEFSSDGGIYTIHSETVPTMVDRHTCTDERREQLMAWVYNYVAPMDQMWSYRGD
jgi:hypothetical protein